MKKIIYLLSFVCLICSTQSFAKNCIGGKVFQGSINEYCISNRPMNWWTAFIWCEKNGRKLATVHQACDTPEERWNGTIGDGACKNLKNPQNPSDWAWTAIPNNTSFAYFLQPSSGKISNSGTRSYLSRALCF